MKKTKKKKQTITLPAEKIIKSGKAEIAQMKWDGSLMHFSKFKGKRIPNEWGFRVITNEACLDSFSISAKNGRASAHYRVSLKDLKKLITKAEKMKKYWAKVNKERKREKQVLIDASFIHLNPELSFWIKY